MDENQGDQPLSSEELLRRAREGLGSSGDTPETPDDFTIQSYPPPPPPAAPQPEVPEEPTPETDFLLDSSQYSPVDDPIEPSYEPPKSEPTSWAPPPVDDGDDTGWTAAAPTGPAPTPARRGGGIASKLWILVVLLVAGVGLFNLLDGSKTVDEIAVGDCMNLPEEDIFYEIDPIDCTETHDLEVYAIIDLSSISPEYSTFAAYPGDDAVYEAAYNACWDEFQPYVGVPYEDSELYIDAFTPTLEGWDEVDDRIANCVLFEVNFDASEIQPTNVSLRNANR